MVSEVDFLEPLLEHGQQNSAQEVVLPSQCEMEIPQLCKDVVY